MSASGRSNAVDLESNSNAEHLIVMHFISSDGECWPPVVIMPEFMQKYRIRRNGEPEFLVEYLPKDTYVVHRTAASMKKEYFIQWAQKFILQTAALREKHDYLLLTMDGFGSHLSCHALSLLQEHNIIAFALPARTSHRTQVLDRSGVCGFEGRSQRESMTVLLFVKWSTIPTARLSRIQTS